MKLNVHLPCSILEEQQRLLARGAGSSSLLQGLQPSAEGHRVTHVWPVHPSIVKRAIGPNFNEWCCDPVCGAAVPLHFGPQGGTAIWPARSQCHLAWEPSQMGGGGGAGQTTLSMVCAVRNVHTDAGNLSVPMWI